MNDVAFHECRIFLQSQIEAHSENNELIKAYVSLIEQKAKFDTAYFSQNAEVQKNWNDNNAAVSKQWAQGNAEITKKREKGTEFPSPQFPQGAYYQDNPSV